MIINPDLPDEYKYETDYRKIPRQYLNANIPEGRGMVKWAPFKTIPAQYAAIEQYIKDQNKVEKPDLFDDQLANINNIVQWKIYQNEIALVQYWKNGYFYNQQAYVKEVNVMKQTIILSNELGNETLEIPISNIKNIE
ncbi:TPA: YolD-like family protein [Staphylococcus aureus]